MKLRAFAVVASACFGCTSVEAPPVPAPTPLGGGQTEQELEPCVDGPYGWSEGSILQNLVFDGFARPEIDSEERGPIALCDFHNETGSDVYPEGSLYGAGWPKPRGLLVIVGAVWHGPCSYEAEQVLPAKYGAYASLGGELLFVLQDGAQPGVSATPSQLQNWVLKFDLDYPAALDPARRLEPYYAVEALPQNLLVDTRTMEIVKVQAGQVGPELWSLFEDLLVE
jgi:hypothetical protein